MRADSQRLRAAILRNRQTAIARKWPQHGWVTIEELREKLGMAEVRAAKKEAVRAELNAMYRDLGRQFAELFRRRPK